MRLHTFAQPGPDLRPHLDRNERGRDPAVGDVHGHFATLRHALAELEVDEPDRVFSLGDLVDRGPDSFDAKDYAPSPDATSPPPRATRINSRIRSALDERPPGPRSA